MLRSLVDRFPWNCDHSMLNQEQLYPYVEGLCILVALQLKTSAVDPLRSGRTSKEYPWDVEGRLNQAEAENSGNQLEHWL